MKVLRCAILAGAILITSPLFAGVFTVSVSGNEIDFTVVADQYYTCAGVELDFDPTKVWTQCTGTPASITLSGFFLCNAVGPHILSAVEYNGSTQILFPDQTVSVTEPPGIGCGINDIVFDITDNATPPDDRRVLLSNTHYATGTTVPTYPYPHYQALLAKDRAIPIGLRIFVNGVGTAGISTTLQLIDPPDPSEYIVGGAGWTGQPVPGATLSHDGDNAATTSAILAGACPGCNTLATTSGANGRIDAELDLPADAKAGDNYRVQATVTFPDGVTRTARSGVITAWKRIFVEKRQMFRNGTTIAGDAPAGITSVVVKDQAINAAGDRFQNGDRIMLVHAPAYGQPKADFHSGTYSVHGHPKTFTFAGAVQGDGTVTTNGTTTIAGTKTHFNKLSPGDVINVPDGSGTPGAVEARVIMTVADNTHLTVDTAPALVAANEPYSIGNTKLIVGWNYTRLPLDRPLTEPYIREPLSSPAELRLNDGIGRIAKTGLATADLFDCDDTFVIGTSNSQWVNAYPAAYTEYIMLPAPSPNIPFPHVQLDTLPPGADVGTWFTRKWFVLGDPVPAGGTNFLATAYAVPPNHQKLVVADAASDAKDAGQTPYASSTPASVASILDLGEVEHLVTDATTGLYGQDPQHVMHRTEVHELAHQWKTNGGPQGHCQQLAYTSTGTYPTTSPFAPPAGLYFCTMNADLSITMTPPWNLALPPVPSVVTQYGNDVTRFHMVFIGSGWDSEYLTVRNAVDPWQP